MSQKPESTLAEYYRLSAVRQRIREYCGAGPHRPPTCVFIAALTASPSYQTWDRVTYRPPEDLDRVLDMGADVSRSLWDSENLIVYLDLDHHSDDHPEAPFVHPAEVFCKLEPVYRAARERLQALDLPLLATMTGRGYHFTGRIPLGDPLVDRLADLALEMPPWFITHESRLPTWRPPTITPRLARASAGLGLVTEHFAHGLMRRTARHAAIPIVFNGTAVGTTGIAGRECVSIDFSHLGDPLDVRHVRVAYGAYQFHRFRPDIVGPPVARALPPFVALPRDDDPLFELLERSHGLADAAAIAETRQAENPEATAGVARLVDDYERSALSAFHREFYTRAPLPPDAWHDDGHWLETTPILPCVEAPFTMPNDLLLKPAHVQHVVRFLMSRGWHPRDIAGLVQSRYLRDYAWGDRWLRTDAQTRAEFDVRVFAGMIATGLDRGVDFNCVSAQEKGLCPLVPCPHDLRWDRERLLARVSS